MYARTQDRDQPTTWATRQAQDDAVCAWGIPGQQPGGLGGPFGLNDLDLPGVRAGPGACGA
ncbi:MAG: hypothetical protein ACLPKE_17515 [Streptosporangiaceae bacterium]